MIMNLKHLLPLCLAAGFGALSAPAAELRVPAFAAYLDPQPDGARISSRSGISGWTDPHLSVLWFGEFKQAGLVTAAVELTLPENTPTRLRLTLNGQARQATVTGQGTNVVTATFGRFQVATGYQRWVLTSDNPAGQDAGTLQGLVLSGNPAETAHFNLKPRRNAASVHLAYPVAKDQKVDAFYCEMTAVEEPLWTYYMACGWHRGYFGMQVNSPTERRIIFSVWDSGGEAVDRQKVQAVDRVTLVAKGEGVNSGDFGNEGTGGHSHLKYLWKTGESQRFVVTALPVDATHTVYSGFYRHPETRKWILISSWRAPKEGGYLRGLYSFSENFGGSNGHLLRKARYGNQWLRTADGQWQEVTTATFSHDPTGKEDRLDRFMGVEQGEFFLSQGGFVPGYVKFGERFTRPTSGQPPPFLDLPKLPLNP
jgi:hypothetical protein